MKKTNVFIMLLVSLLCCYSCDSDIEITSNQMDPNLIHTPDPYYVDFQTALDEALDMFAFQDKQTRTSMKNARTVSSHKEFVANRYTRSLGDTIPVKFHVINFSNNNGYALVSADSRTTPVYAYSLSGNLDVEDAVANTGFGVFLDNAIKYYQEEVASRTPPPLPPFQPSPTDTTLYGDVPLLSVEEYEGQSYHVRYGNTYIVNSGACTINASWHQMWPYNYYCEVDSSAGFYNGYRYVAGCGPVAAAHIMSYYSYPSSFQGTSFDWSLINSVNRSDVDYPSITIEALEVAKLIRKIGVCASAHYGLHTPTRIDRIKMMFENFGYKVSGPDSFSESRVKSSLDACHPVYLTGESDNGGHAWVVNGYIRYGYKKTYYYTYPPYNKYTEMITLLPYYYSCKWGQYYTERDDIYVLNVFREFDSDNDILYNIRPK